MNWPTTPIVTTSMDAGTDVPPRDQILAMAQAVNVMIANPPSGGSGRLIGAYLYTSAGAATHTFSVDATSAIVCIQGAGGGGGGAATTTSGNRAVGNGGGGGAYASFYFSTLPAAALSLVLGAGGTAGSGSGGPGGDGGNASASWAGGNIVASAGAGGLGGVSVSTSLFDHSGSTSGGAVTSAGLSGLGLFLQKCSGEKAKRSMLMGATSALSGYGGRSFSGFGADGIYLTTGRVSGVAATDFGGGGSGGGTSNAASIGGGAGGGSFITVLEYA